MDITTGNLNSECSFPEDYFYMPEPSLVEPDSHLYNREEWKAVEEKDRILLENEAIRNYFRKRGDPYTIEVQRLTEQLAPMKPQTRLSIVIPAYNEQDNIGIVMEQLANQLNVDGTRVPSDLWEVLVLVNAPYKEDQESRNVVFRNIRKTLDVLDEVKLIYPDLPMHVISKIFPSNLAGVGMARSVLHDVAMMRSVNRNCDCRTHPLYIQTMDADTPFIAPDLISRICRHVDGTGSELEILRLRGTYSKNDLIRYPLLNLLTILWEEVFSLMGSRTSNPWTIGRGMVLQAYAHACAGGVSGNENGGAGEDVRIGTSMRSLGNIKVEDLPGFSYFINPRREVLMMEGMKSYLRDRPGVFTRDLHEYARTLKAYLDFEDPRIRGLVQFSAVTEESDNSWLFEMAKCHEQISDNAVEIMINSWWYLLRTEYSLEALKDVDEIRALRMRYDRREVTYPYLQQEFNKLERELYMHSPNKKEIRSIVSRANNLASLDMQTLLLRYGVEVEVSPCDGTPPSMDRNALFPIALKVHDTRSFRRWLSDNLVKGEVDDRNI